MVLRLMLQFIKRGSDDRDAELEDQSAGMVRHTALLFIPFQGFISHQADALAMLSASFKVKPTWLSLMLTLC